MDTLEQVQINGKWKPTRNSEGRLIHSTPEGIYNFWKWFGESKVVDAQGRPQVMYHGSRKSFATFLPGVSGMVGRGIYFSPSAQEASEYATKQEGSQVYSVYLSIKSPKVFPSAKKGVDHFFDTLGDYGGDAPDAYVTTAMKRQGYDGAFVYEKNNILEVVAFSPTQIKSATGNRGTFDPDDQVINNPPQHRRLIRKIQKALTDDLLTPQYLRSRTRRSHPTEGHCAVAAEALYHLLGGKAAGITPMVARYGKETHWWLRMPDGSILDPTAEQFSALGLTPPYHLGRGCGFQSPRGISKRASEVVRRVQRK